MSSTPGTSSVSRARFPSPRWWVSDRHGHVVIAQPPNPALAAWLAAFVVGWTGLVDGRRGVVLGHLGQGALAAWALDELVRGASPVRRLIGAAVLPVVIWRALA